MSQPGSFGRFTPQFLDDIRARIPVSDVVGRRVQLKKRGREFVGLSPFNPEKSPSFTVNDQKGFYHCFSSGKHGDQFGFLMETEGLSFPEAVERLASEAGLEMPKADPREVARAKERASLTDVVEMAAAFFEAELRGGRGREARRTLQTRGMDGNVAARFRLGHAPGSRTALKEHLTKNGVPERDMIAAGLLIAGEDIETPFDRFRDRITFPITDQKGRAIAFGARAMGDAKPKYLNSPETELFHKGATLYNWAPARRAAHDANRIVCVEGYVDVIACARAGIDEAVAPLGTALTETQAQMLWRAADEPTLCFDGDQAGIRAAHRAIDTALPLLSPGKSLRFVFLPEGQDPDDVLRDQGADAVRDALNATRPLSEVLWERETRGQALDTPERKAALEARIKGLLGTIRDGAVRKHYLDDARDRMYRLARAARGQPGRSDGRGKARRRDGDRAGRLARGTDAPADTLVSSPLVQSGRLSRVGAATHEREAILLALLVRHPDLVDRHAEDIAALDVVGRDAATLRDALLAGEGLGAAASRTGDRFVGMAVRLGIVQVAHGTDLEEADAVWRQAYHRHRRSEAQAEVEAARRAFQDEGDERAWAWLQSAREEVLRREHEDAEMEGEGETAGTLDRVIGDARRRIDARRGRR